MRRGIRIASFLLLIASPALPAAPPLTVANAGPRGETTALEEANEVRVVFSEPMVPLGRIPDPVRAPFFRIEPPVKGALRWSGTRTLIFTPAGPLPYATRFQVTVAASAAALSGQRLGKPYRFSFTTPTLRLVRASWYRRTGLVDSPIVVVLQFNQPVRAETIARSVGLAYVPHDWTPPPVPRGVERWRTAEPAGFAAYEAKVAAMTSAARRDAAIPAAPTRTWNLKWFPRSARLAVLQTVSPPAVNSWVSVVLPQGARGARGSVGSREAQEVTLKLEQPFFVEGFRCETACDPEEYNPIRFRSRVAVPAFRRALRLTDVGGGALLAGSFRRAPPIGSATSCPMPARAPTSSARAGAWISPTQSR